jgi:hypothetical protein
MKLKIIFQLLCRRKNCIKATSNVKGIFNNEYFFHLTTLCLLSMLGFIGKLKNIKPGAFHNQSSYKLQSTRKCNVRFPSRPKLKIYARYLSVTVHEGKPFFLNYILVKITCPLSSTFSK